MEKSKLQGGEKHMPSTQSEAWEVRVDGELPEWLMAEELLHSKSSSKRINPTHSSVGCPYPVQKCLSPLRQDFSVSAPLIWVLCAGGGAFVLYIKEWLVAPWGLYLLNASAVIPTGMTPKPSSDTDKCLLRNKTAPLLL